MDIQVAVVDCAHIIGLIIWINHQSKIAKASCYVHYITAKNNVLETQKEVKNGVKIKLDRMKSRLPLLKKAKDHKK